MVPHVAMLGWLGGYYRIVLVDYAGGDNRGEQCLIPFTIVKPIYTFTNVYITPKVTSTLHKCHYWVTIMSPIGKRKAPIVTHRSLLINH